MESNNIVIRKATSQDFDEIWEIFHQVISSGDTYPYSPQTTKEEAFDLWMAPDKDTYVGLLNNKIVGTYYIKANQPGLGSHVANAGYMVSPKYHGQGIGFTLAKHSIEEAKKLGYKAMQYNLVVSTNENAIKLWKKIGFQIIGTTPQGFNHASKGFVDTLIMHRFL